MLQFVTIFWILTNMTLSEKRRAFRAHTYRPKCPALAKHTLHQQKEKSHLPYHGKQLFLVPFHFSVLAGEMHI